MLFAGQSANTIVVVTQSFVSRDHSMGPGCEEVNPIMEPQNGGNFNSEPFSSVELIQLTFFGFESWRIA